MKLIKNMKLTVKLLGSFAILIIALIIVGVISISSMGELNDHSEDIFNNNYLSSIYIEMIRSDLNLINAHTNRAMNPAQSDLLQMSLDGIDEAAASAAASIASFESLITTQRMRDQYDIMIEILGRNREARDHVLTLVNEGDYEGAADYNTSTVAPTIAELREQLTTMITIEYGYALEEMEASRATYASSTNSTIIIIVITSAIGIALGLIISLSIAGDLKKACNAAELLAGGDLTFMVPEAFQKQKDECGNLARNFQAMRDSFYAAVTSIKESSDDLDNSVSGVNTTLNELNNRITDTSAATEELSAGMQETGASSEEMNATAVEIERAVESVAEKAGDGATKSGEFLTRATQMGKDVNDSINKSNNVFNEIKSSLEKALEDSKAVDEINALADAILGITSQTTLLALNASIEAARAGEAGRGFAVVANEISALADNSKNTVTQIQAITKVVMAAVNALASSSTNLLNFVSDDVMKDYQAMLKSAESYTNDSIFVSDMTSDLSATSEELLASVQVMMRAINEVAASAQEGARTTSVVAEQTNDISTNAQNIVEAMSNTKATATQLSDIVTKFKL